MTFQSLLHQVSGSIQLNAKPRTKRGQGFNPFFIRSVVPSQHRYSGKATAAGVSIPSSSGQWFHPCPSLSDRPGVGGFNPFFIRSVVPSIIRELERRNWQVVSIPSSSGQWFHLLPSWWGKNRAVLVSIPSSSGQWFHLRKHGHQVSPSDSFNPFFIRSVVPSMMMIPGLADRLSVSIPSSSGQWFHQSVTRSNNARFWSFNPFFIRSVVPSHKSLFECLARREVSIPSSSGQWFHRPPGGPHTGRPAPFQSLLHQVSGSICAPPYG